MKNFMYCQYCLSYESKGKKMVDVVLTGDGGRTFTKPIQICDDCRKYLLGNFKYVKRGRKE